MTFGKMALSTMTLSIMTLSIITLNKIYDCHFAVGRHAELYFIIRMLNIVMLSVIMPNAVMLSVMAQKNVLAYFDYILAKVYCIGICLKGQ
jgi:hypothetical protein